jgi:hypothetical protein
MANGLCGSDFIIPRFMGDKLVFTTHHLVNLSDVVPVLLSLGVVMFMIKPLFLMNQRPTQAFYTYQAFQELEQETRIQWAMIILFGGAQLLFLINIGVGLFRKYMFKR